MSSTYKNISDRVERPNRKPLTVKGLGDSLYNELRGKEGDSITLELFDPAEVVKGVVENLSYPITVDLKEVLLLHMLYLQCVEQEPLSVSTE